MSCIAGIVELDGAPADGALLHRMTSAMEARAPDGITLRTDGATGFGHALLKIPGDPAGAHPQPCSLDGNLWITADARLDGQRELRGKLRARGREITTATTDAELILHSYGAFGERFLDHLIGDFAFALWDRNNATLLCACDHFGVRPLFYAKTSNQFIFASDIRALLVHPGVTGKINETAVGDFLLFGSYLESDMTIYQGINRLPGATVLRVRQGQATESNRYWHLGEPEITSRKSLADHTMEFRAIFDEAVKDRLRSDNIALEMSGGMDSTSIAAVATKQTHPGITRLHAYTSTCHPLLEDDDEAVFANQVASHLGIPITIDNLGLHHLFERIGNPELATPQPCPSYDLAYAYDSMKSIADTGARVVTSGFMADALFATHGSYHRRLLGENRYGRFAAETAAHLWLHKTHRGLGFRSMLNVPRQPVSWPAPAWIGTDFLKRQNLEDRWHRLWALYDSPRTLDQLQRPWLNHLLNNYEILDIPLVARFPFLDLRLVKLMMDSPNYLKHNKFILRNAMHALLPEAVLRRPKKGLPGDILRSKITSGMVSRPGTGTPLLAEAGYIDGDKLAEAHRRFLAGEGAESTFWSAFILLPIALELWLSQNETIIR